MARQIQITVNVTINDENEAADVDFVNRLEQDLMWGIDSTVNKIARVKNMNMTHGVTLADKLEV